MNRRQFLKGTALVGLATAVGVKLEASYTPYFRMVLEAYRKAMGGMAKVLVVDKLPNGDAAGHNIYPTVCLSGSPVPPKAMQAYLDDIAHADLRITALDRARIQVGDSKDIVPEFRPLRFNLWPSPRDGSLPDFIEPYNLIKTTKGTAARPSAAYVCAKNEVRFLRGGSAIVRLVPHEGIIEREIEMVAPAFLIRPRKV